MNITHGGSPHSLIDGAQVPLGAHFSIAGGLHEAIRRARDYGCSALQIFTGNARTWAPRELTGAAIDAFAAERAVSGITAIAAHAAYLINPASADPETRRRSADALAAEMARCVALEIPQLVLHPGAPGGDGPDRGIKRVARAAGDILDRSGDGPTEVLLETTAGQGTGIGHTFEQLAEILDRIGPTNRVGVCLDTAHVFAAGYDLRQPADAASVLDRFDAVIGLDRLRLLHLNDSKTALGSRVDRHAHIGEGTIGLAGFAIFMTDPRLAGIPRIIETPKPKGSPDWDRINLDRLRGLVRRS